MNIFLNAAKHIEMILFLNQMIIIKIAAWKKKIRALLMSIITP
jgi:hypothetical protein